MHPHEKDKEQGSKLHALIREIAGDLYDERNNLSRHTEACSHEQPQLSIPSEGESNCLSLDKPSHLNIQDKKEHPAETEEKPVVDNSDHINIPLYWLLSHTRFDVFFSIIKECGKINCSIDVFKAIFFNGFIPTVKIQWLGFNNEFAYLMGELITKKIIGKIPKQWSFLCKCFYRADGKDFNPRVLSSQYAQIEVNSNFVAFVKKLIQTLQENESLKQNLAHG
jgi:hypothetical protein